MSAIVICSTTGKCVSVLAASIKAYASCPVLWSRRSGSADFGNFTLYHNNEGKSFGESYNAAIQAAFDSWPCERVYVANDDVVLTPTTICDLERDMERLRGFKVGLLGCRSDFVMWQQNIRCTMENDQRNGPQWVSESHIKEVDVIAPIFAVLTKEAWDSGVRIPPINWFSDDIWCLDLKRLGFKHFVSRAYVHHAGSQTIGRDFQALEKESADWIRKNRPDLDLD